MFHVAQIANVRLAYSELAESQIKICPARISAG
jgi:hypothetical protein